MSIESKTKEEILYSPEMEKRIKTYAPKTINHLLSSMEQYARNRSIEFLSWADGQGWECTLHTDDNVKLWEMYPDVQSTADRRSRPKPLNTDQLYELFSHSIDK